MADEHDFEQLTQLPRRVFAGVVEAAILQQVDEFALSSLELRLGAGVRKRHEAEVPNAMRILQQCELLEFTADLENSRVRLLPGSNLPRRDVEERERIADSRLRRMLLFYLYDQNATLDSGQPISLVPLAETLKHSMGAARAALQALEAVGYLRCPFADGGAGTSFISDLGYRLCDDRDALFAELSVIGIPDFQVTMSGGPEVGGKPKNPGQRAVSPGSGRRFFPAPPGSTWADVYLNLLPMDRVRIGVGGRSLTLDPAEMGMQDRRSKGPDSQWRLLEALLRHGGQLTGSELRTSGFTPKNRQRLNDALSAILQLQGKAIRRTSDGTSWYAGFRLNPKE